MKHLFYYQTNIGKLAIAEENNYITNIFFENERINTLNYEVKETETLSIAYSQIQEYLRGDRQKFNLALNPEGTSFYQSVWRCLTEIPYGKTRSYKEIAQAVGKDKAYRAVGLANNKNPIPIFIPCHRVIGTKGELTGYRGGIFIKMQLIEMEKINS